jgi:diguanylate cyclase (GGDEF)-like protein
MCVPVTRNQKIEGIVLLASDSKRAYDKSQLMIVDILASYFGVAMEKARHYQETKRRSERCALTKLYNYRYFESVLELEFDKLNKGKTQNLSLLLLDLDHFKKVNDKYGHQSGNEILIQVAERLTNIVGERGTVARYGGEEFVILLPNMDRNKCFELAETIRIHLANRSFTLKQHIREAQAAQLVRVTASIGFATAPDDAEDTLDLIRHADRAMYVGAKQAGRNKVAEYKKTS